MDDKRRMYNDLNWTWPIISRNENYLEASDLIVQAIREHSPIEVKTALHMGCGGGGHDFSLKNSFKLTGVDLSENMLEHAASFNPEVEYHQGDMRSVRLGKKFDAVIIADSINYMLTEEDLSAAFRTAFEHLEAGGIFFTYAQYFAENFKQNKTWCSEHKEGDVDISFILNNYDPDPADTEFELTFVYLVRRKGRLKVETDVHRQGLFGRDVWEKLLRDAGFEFRTEEHAMGKYLMFICHAI